MKSRILAVVAILVGALALGATYPVGHFSSLQVGNPQRPAANISTITKTLTDAQTKALPTTAVSVLSAAGANTILQPVGGMWIANTSAGAYTNINAAASFSVKYADGSTATTFVVNDASIMGATANNVTQILGNARLTRLNLQPYYDLDTSGSWGLIPAPRTAAQGVNSALQITFDNMGSGNLTGGNSANSLTLVLFYSVVTVP